jgi:hypothetical protein
MRRDDRGEHRQAAGIAPQGPKSARTVGSKAGTLGGPRWYLIERQADIVLRSATTFALDAGCHAGNLRTVVARDARVNVQS